MSGNADKVAQILKLLGKAAETTAPIRPRGGRPTQRGTRAARQFYEWYKHHHK